MDNIYSYISITSSSLTNFYAYTKSGLIHAINVNDVVIESSSLQNIQSSDAAIMYSQSENLKLTISASSIVCSIFYANDNLTSYLNSSTPNSTQTSTFNIFQALNVSVSSSSFSQCGMS